MSRYLGYMLITHCFVLKW